MPTASPIMVAIVVEISGTDTRCPISPITPRAVVRPRMAVPIGIPIATSVPKVNVRMIIAARMPITSLVDVSFGDSVLPIEPPPTTSMPACVPGLAASSTRCACCSVRSLELTFSSAEMNAVFLSFEIWAPAPCANGLVALCTYLIFLIALYESVIACLLSLSVTLPAPRMWKMIGLEPFCWGGNPACSRSVAAWLPVPGRLTLLSVLAPTCFTVSVTPAAKAIQSTSTITGCAATRCPSL